MANINLLPWREELKAQRMQGFQALMLLGLIAAVIVIGIWYFFISSVLDTYTERKGILTQEINVAKQEIEAIKGIQEQQSRLLDRNNIVQDLQSNRSIPARVLDAIASAKNNDIFLTSIVSKDANMFIKGFTVSESRVADFMRELDKSTWVAESNFNIIRKDEKKNAKKDSTSNIAAENLNTEYPEQEFELTIKQFRNTLSSAEEASNTQRK